MSDFVRDGYLDGFAGRPSLPGTYREAERRAYEEAYANGRQDRLVPGHAQ